MKGPRTLFGRLLLIGVVCLVLAQGLTFVLVYTERSLSARGMMVRYLAADVASSVAMLDRLPAAERAGWLERLRRPHYGLQLGAMPAPQALPAGPVEPAATVAAALSQALAQPVSQAAGATTDGGFRLLVRLQDGTPLTVDVAPSAYRVSSWLVATLAGQLLLLAGGGWLAVRQVTRPLAQLAAAARALQPGQPGALLPQAGSSEVVEAAQAFEQMRQRIDQQLQERVEMLGAISHDLQTPITRMRLRADLLPDEALRDKLLADLGQMQHLVEMGLAYARTSQAVEEALAPTDLGALLDSLVADYQDAGQPVTWLGGPALTATTRPHALRRAVTNLIDNALKFSGAAEVALVGSDGAAMLQVMDRGRGIAPEELDRVIRPFYRVEASRNRDTGGTGLGLAIVQRLLQHCGGRLELAARDGGGLVATIHLPA